MTNSLTHSLRGIITVLNTPFTATDAVDYDALSAHVTYALKAGVRGFLVPAMASEVSKLTPEERLKLVQQVVSTANGRAIVIGGASATTTAERVQLTNRMIDAGCDGVLVSIPYEDDTQYTAAVQAVAQQKPGFLMLQDWDFGGYGLPVPLIVRLFHEIEAFQSLKVEVVPAGIKYSEVLAATEGQLHLAGGWAVTQMIEALDRGVHAMMPTGMHHIYVSIYQLYMTGQRDKAIALFNRIAPVLAFSNQHLDISIHFFKHLLHQQGIYPTPNSRQPILPFDSYHQRSATDLISQVIALENERLHPAQSADTPALNQRSQQGKPS